MDVRSLTAFAGSRSVATGTETDLVAVLREMQGDDQPVVLVFDDLTGEQVDLDWRAPRPSPEPQPARPGRPKLGVVAREVTLLPRHWEWLSAQPGGASVTLRKLVEAARRQNAASDRIRRSQEAAFRFMSATAGNEPGFEEAARSLYACDRDGFESLIAAWPADVASFARNLAADAFRSE